MTYTPNPAWPKKFTAGIREGLAASQVSLATVIQRMLSKPGTGKLYRVNKGRGKRARNLRESGFHRASSPGNPPAVNTNRLRGSWSIAIKSGKDLFPGMNIRIVKKPNLLGFELGSGVPYAPALEFGTRRMKKRPYLKPSMAILEKKLEKIFSEAMRRNLA